MADWNELSELELETIAGGVDSASQVVVVSASVCASEVVALSGAIPSL